jgi:hypothetical protein
MWTYSDDRTAAMYLHLLDPAYTDQLASFLTSLGQSPVVAGPDRVELTGATDEESRLEIEIYLRVWRILHPEAEVRFDD